MKAKTIKKVLQKKIDAWAGSITDPLVKDAVLNGTIVTGGSIASMLLREKVNDYDVYFKDLETAEVVTKHYVKKYNDSKAPTITPEVVVSDDAPPRVRIMVKSAGIAGEGGNDSEYRYFEMLPDEDLSSDEYVANNVVEPDDSNEEIQQVVDAVEDGKEKYRPVFMSSNAITLSQKIQIIIRFYGTPDEIHENYDFTHCTCWWSSWDGHLELRPEAMEALLARELRYQGSKYPLCSIIRTRKFVKRGWAINAGQYLKMCLQLNEFDLTDVNVLEDQLTGVDVAYFHQVLSYIRRADKKVDSTYLCEIIDRIF